MKKLILTALACLVIAPAASAGISLDFQAGYFRDADGELLAENSLLVFIADMDGSGFDAYMTTPLGTEGFLIDPTDMVIGVSESRNNGAGVIFGNLPLLGTASETNGKQMAMLFFDKQVPGKGEQELHGITGVEEGVNYGIQILPVSVPADGDTGAQVYYEDGSLGVYSTVLSTSSFVASYAVVPEPATMALLGLGGLAMIRRRRNG